MSKKFRSNVSGKKRLASLTMAALWSCQLLAAVPGWAAPTDGVVVSGTAVINQTGSVTNINQSTQTAAINWQGFSIGANETVNFNQPNASAVTLNRVVGNEASVIEGALNANGQVFLVNSNGILFSKGSSVNTAGFVASTLDISDEDFSAGKYTFKSGSTSGSVINMGTITAKDGGYVGLLGSFVSNQGVIVATKGTVALAAGSAITLNFNGDSMVSVTVDEGVLNALVENKQAIYADGGTVILTAKAAEDLLSAQVNNSGIIQARTIDDLKGTITLKADGGTANVDGTLDASAPTTGNGGFIETSGDKVYVADSAVVTTKSADGESGTWLIDPTNFTITSGTTAQTTSGIGAETLASALASGSVSIATSSDGSEDGDINVNAAVSWLAGTTLTLTAAGDVNVNAAITASGANAGLVLNAGSDININNAVTLSGASAKLALNYGGYNGTTVTTAATGTNYAIRTAASYSGTVLDANGDPVAQADTSGGVYGSITFTDDTNLTGLTINGAAYTLVHSMSQLDGLDGYDSAAGTGTAASLSGYYAIAENLDASGTTYKSALIGTLTGTLAGLGHTISGLKIVGADSSITKVALIGTLGSSSYKTAAVRDIGLLGVDIKAYQNVAGLVGSNSYGTITNAYVTGTVSGRWNVGGLVGKNMPGTIGNCWANVQIIGTDDYSDATTNLNNLGGLVGYNTGTISNSHASGTVTVASSDLNYTLLCVGGLVGYNVSGTITNSYAEGNVATTSNANNVGGLVGSSIGTTGTVTNSYAIGAVTGGNLATGGLIGYNNARITNCYATGAVSGAWNSYSNNGVGGLVGKNDTAGTITDSYASGAVTGRGTASGGLVGVNGGTITNCYALGNVTPQGNAAGGLVGENTGRITDSYAMGNVSGEAAGGLAGGNSGTIINCRAYGDVFSSYTLYRAAGGLVGQNYGTIEFSFATGSVTIPGFPPGDSGLVGKNEGVITNSTYHDVKAEAAVRQAAFESAALSQSGSTMGEALQSDEASSVESGVLLAGGGQDQDSVDDHIVYADSNSYGAHIQSVSVDGVEYNLENENTSGAPSLDKDAVKNKKK